MKRLTICTIGVFLLGLGLAACEEGAGKRGNTVDETKTVTAPEDNPDLSLDGGKK